MQLEYQICGKSVRTAPTTADAPDHKTTLSLFLINHLCSIETFGLVVFR